MTKIVIIIDHLGVGGAQRQVLEYLKCADRDCFDFTVVSLSGSRNQLARDIRALGIDVVEVSHRGFFSFMTIKRLIHIIKKEKPDIVHTYLFAADCYGRLAAACAGVKVIIRSVRDRDLWKDWYHICVDRILNEVTSQIIINAKAVGPFLTEREGIAPNRIVAIPNGIDVKRFQRPACISDFRQIMDIPKETCVIAMIARFSPQKDHITFLKAAKEILKRVSGVYFVLVGDGETRKSLMKSFLLASVSFLGERRDVADILPLIDIGVLATRHEGFPNILMEFMAAGKPVVATDIDGCRELVVHEKTGFLIPEADVDALVEKLMLLINDEALRKKMGDAGRVRVEEQFTSDKLAKRTEQVYHQWTAPKIGFILSQFPAVHETFILREFLTLKNSEPPFEIYSLKPCRDKLVHKETEPLMPRTFYSPWIAVFSCIFWFFRNPVRFFRAFFSCVVVELKNPVNFLKAKITFGKAAYFARVIRKRNVRYLHAHWATMPTTAAKAMSILLGIPFGFTAHAWDIFLNSPANLKNKLRDASLVVTCTEYNKKHLESLDRGLGKKVVVNYHGVELEKFLLRSNRLVSGRGENLILAIGRLVEQKGFEFLIRACSILQKKGVSFKCVIVGNGPLKKSLKDLSVKSGLSDKVVFKGMLPQNEIKSLLNQAAVFAAPSVIAKNGDRDGIPNVILEAMAIGVPIVAGDVSGISEAVINRETGLLVQPGDAKALADALEQVLHQKIDVEEMIISGRRKIEKDFDAVRNANALKTLFPKI